MPFSNGSEAPIIDRLREDGDLVLSLVAVDGDAIVGHIAFSPVTVGESDAGWYGLGPVSVRPDLQRRGIGSHLVTEGLDRIRKMGAKGCVLVGDPAYYSRFGFRSDGDLTYADVPAEYVQWMAFGTHRARGALKYAPAFESA